MYPAKYLKPVAFIAPLNVLEEFSKPLSLSFRLLGNILADELTLAVLYGLVPLGIPIPVFLLGLFTSGRLLGCARCMHEALDQGSIGRW